ncbi:lipase-like PAD4 isoform X1 [Abrus precatorius]|uniref:Lipase-like PAD4 isoform X1 n=2 Tax=Abrus precatorius TaxID=3816 RepID=A0A8B8KDY9_ABRPR|nr:lipase-like PAD4 isoform X1 [Abrus precatorius]
MTILQSNQTFHENSNSPKLCFLPRRFETREMLATFVSSTPLLSESWRLCSKANATPFRSFVTERVAGVVYVAFSGVHMAGGSDPNWRNLTALDSIGGVPMFSSRRNKEGEEPVMVHAGMLNLFFSLFNSFQNQMLEIVGNTDTKSVVITGHSIGGATASLCTLWLLSYLQSISSSLSILCITYGAPLLGNQSFSQAIFKERWGGNFCHVVSKHDIMPRLLFAPITPLTTQLNILLQFWHLSMTSPDFEKLEFQISDKEKAKLFTAVMDYLEAVTQDGETSVPILFHPFGNYFFVSEDGAVCVDNPAAIVKMMHLMLATGSPTSSIEDHLKYGDYVNKMSSQILNQRDTMQKNIPDSSYEAGLELAIQSSGIASQESAIKSAKECLKTTRRMGPSPTQNAASLAVSLSKVVPYRAQIEWYKTWCDEQDDQMGYYDSFKSRDSSSSKRDMKVNMNRCKLAKFWNNVIDMLERSDLPHDFDKRAKWVNTSHFYKLLVEPLDIAEYYGKGMHRTKGHYMQHGRERRYEIFDRWWKDRRVTSGEENKERSKFASLTQDSCFWARVEEARDWLNCVRSERDTNKLALLWDKIENFEKYAMKLIEDKEVSCDVLAKNSSYSLWVEDLRELKQLKAKVKRFPHQFTGFLDGEVVP